MHIYKTQRALEVHCTYIVRTMYVQCTYIVRPVSAGEYRVKRTKGRQVILANKKNSWHKYVSKLNARTSIIKCWDMVRKIKGKGGSLSVKHIEKNGTKITQPRDI